MLLDAIVLAGGKSSRLSGVPKATLTWRGSTLLQNTIDAVLDAGARRVAVVGPGPDVGPGAAGPDARGPGSQVLFAREDPPFGGPASAVAAGMRALQDLDNSAGHLVLVLACDMPRVAAAVAQLVDAAPLLSRDGLVLLDAAGMRQPLAAVYGRSALADAVDGLRASSRLDGASMRSLISVLDLVELPDGRESTRDVDTWEDASAFGIERPDDTLPTSETLPTSNTLPTREGVDHE
ncbi:molybdenum cofactor guanylyltransferase [Agreia pratensis]|uniref:Molybdopterin-guanine dinucleotide biosynthesis protein A n=1 Tax=Agreia pratensis TaxID=150121 RepID=A0A1X7JE14_9MICO|nr:NTP transferase domain-containing protein [Agreia pratensis]SMG25860.1 Molybdopterin-guanine dinucleotide biosynthesis protein A [Agreia pratensis]